MTLTREQQRWLARSAFFALFVLAPPLNIFRLDLTLGHFILFGQPWTLGLSAFQSGEIGSGQAVLNLIVRGFLPLAAIVGVLAVVAWKWGRLYCGWLCPHFSVVESVNALMRRVLGKPTLWESAPAAAARRAREWPLLAVAILGFAFLWALTLLTYLLPPFQIYSQLLTATLARNPTIFLIAATTAFTLEFLLARHLFCRFGCAVGVFQSFVWMANPRAPMVMLDRGTAAACAGCAHDCVEACPMRLNPRGSKRDKFACTQCGACVTACVQRPAATTVPLHWMRRAPRVTHGASLLPFTRR
jgi:ferredoxin-type protein NapH